MLKGLVDRLLTPFDVLKDRIFRTRVKLSEVWGKYYDRDVVTPALGKNRRHELSYAY